MPSYCVGEKVWSRYPKVEEHTIEKVRYIPLMAQIMINGKWKCANFYHKSEAEARESLETGQELKMRK